MWIKRDIIHVLDRLVGERPVVVLTGARQTGKTSLVRRVFPSFGYVSLDIPHQAALAEEQPAAFLERYPPPLIVDETQYAPGLFRHLKVAVDRDRDRAGQFLLTGSQKFLLMREVSDSLAGRAAILELEPLTWREVKPARLEDFIVRGGLPELHARPDLDAFEYHGSYMATYLERDVRSLLRVGNLRDFERFIRACAFRTAQLLNRSELARDVGISPSTANDWLSVLQASNQITLLEPWFQNRTRSMVKAPKLYMTDTGLAAYLLGLRDGNELARSQFCGPLWETFVCGELRRRYALHYPGSPIYFWRDRGAEVDFILHHGGRFVALEAKWSEQPTRRDLIGVEKLRAFLGTTTEIEALIVCRTPQRFPVSAVAEAVSVADRWFERDDRLTLPIEVASSFQV